MMKRIVFITNIILLCSILITGCLSFSSEIKPNKSSTSKIISPIALPFQEMDTDILISAIANQLKQIDIENSSDPCRDIEVATSSKYITSFGFGRIVDIFEYDEHLYFYYDCSIWNDRVCYFYVDQPIFSTKTPYRIAFLDKEDDCRTKSAEALFKKLFMIRSNL